MDQAFRAGVIEVRPVERELRVEGTAVPVGARAFDVLLALLQRRDRVVTKAELLDTVWPDTVVEENNLQAQVSQLRRLLGAKAIATIPGRGYRLALAFESDSPSARPATSQNPPRTSTLLGRDADLDAVAALLEAHRLVTIAGPGGIGKTRLAAEVARSGTWPTHWVDLAAIASADKIPPAIANAAGVPLGEGAGPAQLARALGSRETLLVLDNCEHLAGDVGPLAEAFLESAPTARILATSQEALHVSGEHVYRLGALPIPPTRLGLEAARGHAAIQLIEQRAQAADGRFALKESTVAAAIELCRRLDGIPLALEMAAARLPFMGFEPLLGRLDERLRLLRSPARDAPARQQTLQATIEWSHSLLSEAERLAFRRLGTFVASFRLEAAQRVAGWGDLDEWSALDALMGLADKSLLQVEGGEPPRYRLLESARLYALAELERATEAEEASRRHGQAMAWLADVAANAYWGMVENPSPAAWYPDYDDFHAAWDRAALRRDTVVMGGVARILSILDFERNVFSTVRRRKEDAFNLLDIAAPVERARLLQVICLFRTIPIPQLPRVRAAQMRVEAYRAIDHPQYIHFSLARLAADLATDGRMAEARAALAEAIALDNPSWTPHFRWFLPYQARNAALYGDDPAQLMHWARRMLELAEAAKWPSRIAESRVACAEAALAGGDVPGATGLASRAAEECRRLDQPMNLFDALTVLCAANLRAGAIEEARSASRAALALPWPVEVATACFDQVAYLAALDGRMESAALLFGFADRGYKVTQDRRHTHGAHAEAAGSATARRALGKDRFDALRRDGAALSEVRAVAIARECLG